MMICKADFQELFPDIFQAAPVNQPRERRLIRMARQSRAGCWRQILSPLVPFGPRLPKRGLAGSSAEAFAQERAISRATPACVCPQRMSGRLWQPGRFHGPVAL